MSLILPTKKKLFTFADLRNEYPDINFWSTGDAPTTSGKTKFSRVHADVSKGIAISFDKWFYDFCNRYPQIIEKITNIPFNPSSQHAGQFVFDNIFCDMQRTLNLFEASEQYMEEGVCAEVQNLKRMIKAGLPLPYSQDAKSKGSWDTEIVYGTSESNLENIFLEFSPLPENVVKLSQNVVDIFVPRNIRRGIFVNRETSSEANPKQIEYLTQRFDEITQAEERILSPRPRGNYYFDNTDYSETAMRGKVEEIVKGK